MNNEQILICDCSSAEHQIIFRTELDDVNFIQKCVLGKAKMEDIDKYVALWHASNDENLMPIYDYLGMTYDEYRKWVNDYKVLDLIIENHKNDDIEADSLYITIHLSKLGFWRRLYSALKYVCGYSCRYGHFDEIVTTKKKVLDKLNKL